MAIYWTPDNRVACRPPGVLAKHGRIVRLGQIWRSNDPRRLRGVRVLDIDLIPRRMVTVENIVTKRIVTIPLRNFTVGRDGWSLDKENWS